MSQSNRSFLSVGKLATISIGKYGMFDVILNRYASNNNLAVLLHSVNGSHNIDYLKLSINIHETILPERHFVAKEYGENAALIPFVLASTLFVVTDAFAPMPFNRVSRIWRLA